LHRSRRNFRELRILRIPVSKCNKKKKRSASDVRKRKNVLKMN